MKSHKNIYFIHANGYPPNAYSSMFSKLQKSCNINYFNLVSDSINIKKLKNWQPFHASFIKTIKTNENNIGIGHSIGGNLILRSAISHPELFAKVILLDPTLFIPRFILFWKFIKLLKMDDYLHPLSKKALRRKMNYKTMIQFLNLTEEKMFSNI